MQKNAVLSCFLYLLGCVICSDEALRNGANDVLVVKRHDGKYASTRWEAQFGKIHSIFKSREGKIVHIFVNNVPARQRMSIEDTGIIGFEGSSENYMTSKELKELNLNPGQNTGKYVAKELGVELEFSVFLYEDTDRLVFTDIDGTITESDIRGHVLPKLGITAEHEKVVELYDRIDRRGYHIIYLSARSYSQDDETKYYLFEMLQNRGGYSLPMGPVLLSPLTFIDSLKAEVYHKNPDIQKTEAIKDVWNAFNTRQKSGIMDTVVAAYGNKESDVRAYKNAGIDADKIYIVDHKGELVTIGNNEISTYAKQTEKLDEMYPKLS